jgi:hypothetical protein
MKIQRLFSSKKLPESRIGIGWIQEKLGKNDSEKYFKVGQKAADESYSKGDEDEKVVLRLRGRSQRDGRRFGLRTDRISGQKLGRFQND